MLRLFKIVTWVTVVVSMFSCSEKDISPVTANFQEQCLLTTRTFYYSSNNLSGTTTFEYDQRGNLLHTNSQNSLKEVSISNYVNYYNSLMRLEKQEKHANGVLESYEFYTYHDNGVRKSSENHLLASNHITLTEFDKRAKLIKTTRSQSNGVNKDEYSYNQHGQLAYFRNTQNGKPYLERSYDYNNSGLKTQYSQLIFDTQRKSIVQWEYDENDKLLTQKWHAGASHDVTLKAIKHHHYDGRKRVASLKVWNDIQHKEHYRYQYDDKEQLVLTEKSVDGTTFFKEREISYHLNGNAKVVKDYKANTDKTSFLQLSQSYDEEGNLLSRTKLKSNGEVDWEWTYSYTCQQVEVF